MVYEMPWKEIEQQDYFREREVGLKHPDNNSFVRIRDGGEVEIGSGDSTAIILNPRNSSVTIFADHVKFVTKHDQGIRFNHLTLNEAATHFDEPALLEVDDINDGYDVYKGVEYYLQSDDEDAAVTKSKVTSLISAHIPKIKQELEEEQEGC